MTTKPKTKNSHAEADAVVVVKPPTTFVRDLFRLRHRRVWEPEPDIERDDVQTAFYLLRTRTGLSWDQLQLHTGEPKAMLQSMERQNSSMKPLLCRKCAAIARDFQLPVLAQWFEAQEQLKLRKPKGRRRGAI